MTRSFPIPRRRAAVLVAGLAAAFVAGCAGGPARLTLPAVTPLQPAAPAPVLAPGGAPVAGPVRSAAAAGAVRPAPSAVTVTPAPAGQGGPVVTAPPPAAGGPVVVAPAPTPVSAPAPVSGPVSGRAPGGAGPAPIVIHNDRGGNVVQMMARRADLAASGRPVRITGACDSACTMLITLPNACLAPDATVGFHAPRLPGTQVIPPIVDQLMATTYRNGIRARWFNEWRHSLSIQRITARDYVALDPMTRLCS